MMKEDDAAIMQAEGAGAGARARDAGMDARYPCEAPAGRRGEEEDAGPPCGPTVFSDAPPGPAQFAGHSAAANAPAEAAELRPDACFAREWTLLAEGLGCIGGPAGCVQAGGSGSNTPPVLFPALKWASVEKANTLMKAKALPAVKALTQIFSEAGFAPSVNFNVGSGELSLTIPLFASDEDELVAARPAVVRAMLAALPEQRALERFFAAIRARGREDAGLEADVGATGDLLANRCLEIFCRQTGVGIWQRTVDTRTRTVKLAFANYDDLFGGTRKMLKYAPCYSSLTGFTDSASYRTLRAGSSEELQAAIDAALEQLMADMTACFWQHVAEFPYVASPSLRSRLGDELRAYMASGLGDPAGGFQPPPETQFSFFLFGGAGTGKSTMVAAFSRALQATLQRFIDGGRRVDIVKVPLNGHTPESLGMILRVQGISDMSIERLLEQTVQRGSLAILHFEEVPEDPVLQQALVSTAKNMLSTLLRRYRQYAGNVILAYTSNYPAAPSIASSTTEITVVAPSAQDQWKHCVSMLEKSVKAMSKASHVSVTLKYTLPEMQDMRPLCQWWTTLAFHIAGRVAELAAKHQMDSPPRSIAAVLSSANGGGVIGIDLKIDREDREQDVDWVRLASGASCIPCAQDRVWAAEREAGLRSRGSSEQADEDKKDEDTAAQDRVWGGWGVLTRVPKTKRRVFAPRIRSEIRSWWEALIVDNDTMGPFGEGPYCKTLPSVLPQSEPEKKRCGVECPGCGNVGNIWTFVDCQGNYREPYIPPVSAPTCTSPVQGVDGDEHVQSEELPALHSRTNSVDVDALNGHRDLVMEGHDTYDENASTSSHSSCKKALVVSSMDGFFFVEGDGGEWGAQGTEADKFKRRKNATLVNMCLSAVLKPGAIVLTGADDKRAAVESEILEQAQVKTANAGAEMRVVRVDLREEDDKVKVNGHQSQIRGGLFKVIDDFNNPNTETSSSHGLLAIVCNVNETGQYMLRELLETNGESRTHRYAIRKDRVLFILSVDANAALQEMTVSRAHSLIAC
jgi:hypothetical protein